MLFRSGHIPSLLFLANQAAYPQNTGETAALDNGSPSAYQQVKLSIVQVGADAVPESMKDDTNTGLRWMTVQLVGE